MSTKINIKNLWVSILFLFFIFQSPLEQISSVFKYIDESIIVIAVMLIIRHFGKCSSLLKKKKFINCMMFICFYLIVGIVANIIYKYQEMNYVVSDIIINMKFFISIAAGYLMFKENDWSNAKEHIRHIIVLISYIIFILVIADRLLNIWPGELRYGIKSAQLFFGHSTYLAASMAFMIAYLTMVYNKKNTLPILLDIIVLALTLRSKAIVSATVYIFLFWLIIKRGKKLKLWQIIFISLIGIFVAWGQIEYYFIELSNKSARSVLLTTSLKIIKDYFPIGTGFGTFASHSAGANYSPVYVKYGFMKIWDLTKENSNAFFDDTFWPIIFGQTGILGTFFYVGIFSMIIKKCFSIGKKYKYFYLASVFIIAYLLISSVAEPSFNNPIAIPLGVLLGIIFRQTDIEKENSQMHKTNSNKD